VSELSLIATREASIPYRETRVSVACRLPGSSIQETATYLASRATLPLQRRKQPIAVIRASAQAQLAQRPVRAGVRQGCAASHPGNRQSLPRVLYCCRCERMSLRWSAAAIYVEVAPCLISPRYGRRKHLFEYFVDDVFNARNQQPLGYKFFHRVECVLSIR
jgi:hypothetical protein